MLLDLRSLYEPVVVPPAPPAGGGGLMGPIIAVPRRPPRRVLSPADLARRRRLVLEIERVRQELEDLEVLMLAEDDDFLFLVDEADRLQRELEIRERELARLDARLGAEVP